MNLRATVGVNIICSMPSRNPSHLQNALSNLGSLQCAIIYSWATNLKTHILTGYYKSRTSAADGMVPRKCRTYNISRM